jgi:probable H4MPT-linked C1 transfer pathway protein
MVIVGWDIGGANLKQAASDRRAWSCAFELWQRPRELAAELERLLAPVKDKTEALAVTMTGELADCFATKSEGVEEILAAVEFVAQGRPIAVWSTAGEFLSLAQARYRPIDVAAANWLALAHWIGRWTPKGSAMLIDIGSTTTDLIPIVDGRPHPQGLTDVARLQSGELVYTGVRRTPLCAVSPRVVWRGGDTPVATELFATTLDVYLLLGDIEPDALDLQTANGHAATLDAAHDRIARMLCCDRNELSVDDAMHLARQWSAAQQSLIAERLQCVIRRLPGSCDAVVLSGSGEFLARRVLDALPEFTSAARISLTDRLGPRIAEAACAYSVACLLAEARQATPRT